MALADKISVLQEEIIPREIRYVATTPKNFSFQ